MRRQYGIGGLFKLNLSNNMIDVTFDDNEIERLFGPLNPGQMLSAVAFLAAMEGAEEEDLEDAFAQLEEKDVRLDIADLPKATGDSEAALRLRQEEQLAQTDRLLQELEPSDPLRLYLEELAQIPCCGDTALLSGQLAEANQQGKENCLQEQILNLSLHRVVELACRHTGYGVLLLDLIQEGSMGLWQGMARYQGGDFESFRDAQICRAMAKVIVMQARASGLGQKMRQAMPT